MCLYAKIPHEARVIDPNAGWVAATLVPGSANRSINPQSRSTSFAISVGVVASN